MAQPGCWRLSITLDAELCANALDGVSGRFGRPEMTKPDQGSHRLRLNGPAATGARPPLDGGQRALLCRDLRRAALAVAGVRMLLSAPLPECGPGSPTGTPTPLETDVVHRADHTITQPDQKA